MNDEVKKKLIGRMERVEKEIEEATEDLRDAAENDQQAADLRHHFSNILKEQTAIDRLLHGMRQ